MIYTIVIILVIVALLIILRPRKRVSLRPQNRALNYLLNNYQPLNTKVKDHIDNLPMLGAALLELIAKKTATDFRTLKDGSVDKAMLNAMSYSIFDLILTVYFDEIFEFSNHDKELSSLLFDALLFQALGQEPGNITEADMVNHDSYKTRGIQKYLLQKQLMSGNTKMKDPSGWLLGTEVSCILTGGTDIAVVMPVQATSIPIRQATKACIRHQLYNEKPAGL